MTDGAALFAAAMYAKQEWQSIGSLQNNYNKAMTNLINPLWMTISKSMFHYTWS
jgi:hypothetical protein